MKLKKILISISFVLVGMLILSINPESYIHRLIFFVSIGCSVCVALYRGNRMSFRYFPKDKTYLALFILFLITAVLSIFLMYKSKNSSYTIFILSLTFLLLAGLLVRGRKIKDKR